MHVSSRSPYGPGGLLGPPYGPLMGPAQPTRPTVCVFSNGIHTGPQGTCICTLRNSKWYMYRFLKSRGQICRKNMDGTCKAHVTTKSREGNFVRTYLYVKVKTTLMPMYHEAPGQFTSPIRTKTLGNHRACRAGPQDFMTSFGSVKTQ